MELVVERRGQLHSFVLEETPESEDTYPYNSDYFYRGENYGIFHVEDFRLGHIQKMFDLIKRYGAKNVLLFTSAIVAPIFEALVTQIPEFVEQLKDVHLYTEIVEENSLGGNYDMMDSRFVEDYGRIVRKRIKQGVPLDLILIPDAFGSPWGTDLNGFSYAQIGMEFGVPVERIAWLMVYGREV